ncbi:hypothetical protein HPQ32_19270 [Photobacterium carnosum]|uniref:hypothetical protein n=1 Tax=Photobacterium carnosum TaxID=2023717 RepID=UPI001C929074|nr:hypothetical protein [Photobacterium carnosum]MBY3790501.1 hypothetical protein [Photobacterium carnosum]MCD9535569.1 hypothetical protein [Photobacterium carnosum]
MSTVDKVLDVTLSYIQENDWCGACYATAAINHILLNELEIQSELCIGLFLMDNNLSDSYLSRMSE